MTQSTVINGAPEVSVIVPLGARHEDLPELCAGLEQVLRPIVAGYEVIVIDDGAGESTRESLRQSAARWPSIRVVRLQRRMGESTALAIGAQLARGRIIVTLDAYLHVALAELPKLLAPVRDGVDLVCVWRHPRHDSGLSQSASNLFNAVARRLTNVPVHDLNCRTRVMRREVLQDLPVYGDLHRFLPIFAVRRGYTWREIQLPQQPGKSEIGASTLSSYVGRFLDLLTLLFLTRFVKRPLHFFGLMGVASLTTGGALALYLCYVKLGLGLAIGHKPMLLLAVLLIVVGIQIGSIGLLGELMIFTHARDLPDYVVSEEVGGGGA